jgi:hypothetical protein
MTLKKTLLLTTQRAVWLALLAATLVQCAINDRLYTNFLSIPSDVGSLEVFWYLDDTAQRLHMRMRTPLMGPNGYIGVGFCDKDIPDAV